jgi:hypothetical protein
VEELLLSAIKYTNGLNDVRETAIHTDEPLVPVPNPSQNEISVTMLRKYRSSVLNKL